MNVTLTLTTTVVAIPRSESWYEYLQLFFMMMGPTVGAIAGARIARGTAKEERDARRRERLSKNVYRPLLSQLEGIEGLVKIGKRPDLGGLDKIRQEGAYYGIDEITRKGIGEFYKTFQVYQTAYDLVENRSKTVVREAIEQFGLNDNDLADYRSGNYEVSYDLMLPGKVLVSSTTPFEAYVQGETPTDILQEGDFGCLGEIICRISGVETGKAIAEKLSRVLLEKAQQDMGLMSFQNVRSATLQAIHRLMERLSLRAS